MGGNDGKRSMQAHSGDSAIMDVKIDNPHRVWRSIAVLAIWASITMFLSRLWRPAHSHHSLQTLVSTEVRISLAVAILFLVGMIILFRWYDVGLGRPRSSRSLLLLWFPGLYICLFICLAVATGLPPTRTIAIVLANTIMVGISEELAFRGVLYKGLRSALSVWPAILASTVLFGAVHLFNGFATGNFGAAAVQSITAFMSGMALMALRIRTGSLWPGIVLHSLWDFILVASAAALALRVGHVVTQSHNPGLMALPLLLMLPNFLYGIFLLRNVARENPKIAPFPVAPG